MYQTGIDAVDESGMTAMHWAVLRDHEVGTRSTYSTLYVFKKIVLFFGTHSHTVLYIAKAK